jgi:hypothetical protein
MTNQDPDIRETHDLIASDMVVGTNVYDIQGNHIGQVERLILEKRGGRLAQPFQKNVDWMEQRPTAARELTHGGTQFVCLEGSGEIPGRLWRSASGALRTGSRRAICTTTPTPVAIANGLLAWIDRSAPVDDRRQL